MDLNLPRVGKVTYKHTVTISMGHYVYYVARTSTPVVPVEYAFLGNCVHNGYVNIITQKRKTTYTFLLTFNLCMRGAFCISYYKNVDG